MTTWRASSTLAGERPQAWQDMAACRTAVTDGLVTGPDADPWFPGGDKELAAQALAYCRACSVLLECELERKAAGISEGVWAGRIHAPRAAGRPVTPNTTMHGAARYELWTTGLNDTQISRQLGVTRDTITNWRRYHKLPGNPGVGDLEQRLELHRQGLCDREIAAVEGSRRGIIASWRARNQLPANPDPTGTPRNRFNGRDDARDARRRDRVANGWTDREIAQDEGLTKSAIKSWRQRQGIPANREAS